MRTNPVCMTLALIFLAAINGCKKDDEVTAPPPIVNEEEVITTMIFAFTGQGGADDKELRFTDADGDGGGVPVFDLDTLQAASDYSASIILLNETADPVDTISNEVLEEGTDHQFFFQATGSDITFVYADADANGAPIGLATNATTGTPSVGTVKVTLRHQPDKSGSGVSGGDISNAGGETDIEVTFPLVIE